ncbi:DNA-3-methyladenine glycosidase [Pluralibacter gergoviae]|nr:DNA-3-methyladenine glycosidase [Pluralibacter gergoviae]
MPVKKGGDFSPMRRRRQPEYESKARPGVRRYAGIGK